ncbi:RelA/SpoT domain-containing protein [Aeromonas hydrophila]|uniref:RelA/SpoT domain-containing protein n=1 Tax=Aeromonas hydrophila TaxID=644 RepID=UPI001CC75D73|nr:hypothetical protein [Aeromonas hydrophila]GJC04134.1 hypothetical protein KAM385_11630 [Aeromonas hydrophila]
MKTLSNIDTLDLSTFLERNRITQDDFTKAEIEWNILRDIGNDHFSHFDARIETAEFFAKVIQGCNKVHSVRWRVKNPEHLMEKIVRKRVPETKNFNKEYLKINIENYHEIVTDLVGIRALHLFKDDYLEIDTYLTQRWNHIEAERPIYYFRDGDDQDTVPEMFDKKKHPAGYRSIHYIFESQPLNKKLFTEVQVRTIFEEGWSEIDHVVRYPNFSEDPNVARFLQIFNRLAGSADEMGAFAKQLVKEIQDKALAIAHLIKEREDANEEIEDNKKEIHNLFEKLKSLDNKNKEKTEIITKLEAAVKKQDDISPNKLYGTRISSDGRIFVTLPRTGAGNQLDLDEVIEKLKSITSSKISNTFLGNKLENKEREDEDDESK